MSKENGGPAFPTVDANREEDYGTRGMSLRDYFAAKAMQASRSRMSNYTCWEDMAKDSYEIADAMLKERAK